MTPQLRALAPPGPVEYFLDCSVEHVEMDAFTRMALQLYGRDEDLVPLIGTPKAGGSSYKERRRLILDRLVPIADAIVDDLPSTRRAGLVRLGLKGVVYEVDMLAETMSAWAMEDEIEGGALMPWKRGRHVRAKNAVVFPRTSRKLRSPRFVRRYIKNNREHCAHLRELSDIMAVRAARWGIKRDDAIQTDLRAQRNNGKEEWIKGQWDRLLKRPASRSVAKARHKVILRSLKMAVAALGQEAVSAFLRGEEVKLIGAESMLVVQKRGGLHEVGHGPLSIGLASRDGTTLADLCTYIEDTPTLDQLTGFALMMRSGQDRAVLETANITTMTDAGSKHELVRYARESKPPVPSRVELRAMLVADYGEERADRLLTIIDRERRPEIHVPPQWTHEDRRARNEAYWNETGERWIAAVRSEVVGARNFNIFQRAN